MSGMGGPSIGSSSPSICGISANIGIASGEGDGLGDGEGETAICGDGLGEADGEGEGDMTGDGEGDDDGDGDGDGDGEGEGDGDNGVSVETPIAALTRKMYFHGIRIVEESSFHLTKGMSISARIIALGLVMVC